MMNETMKARNAIGFMLIGSLITVIVLGIIYVASGRYQNDINQEMKDNCMSKMADVFYGDEHRSGYYTDDDGNIMLEYWNSSESKGWMSVTDDDICEYDIVYKFKEGGSVTRVYYTVENPED